ncbi:16S rRNA (uracil(1498)-N(3))-methyltransferase [Occultella glacieicola]|uniref:16S rRNA (uracil(1498)-N(3))-methyltransferase n=1 Tax=Occultella glacieicola TaxID=2518684 RepID=UPI001F1F77D6|nr:16S rRNA (uracil(1498)-N(3))-methyltransferase [Occultella glacieicola]
MFLAPAGELDLLTPGARYTLVGPEARHAATVRRLRAGEEIELVDGVGVRVRGAVAEVVGGSDAAVVLEVDTVVREPEPAPAIVLVQALAKGSRDELAIEAGTEVGLDGVIPWQSERSVSHWRGDKATKGRARWQQIVAAAAKQSRRARVPEVAELVVGAAVVARAGRAVADGGAVLVLHESATEAIADVRIGADAPEVLLVVGPEGGLSDAEVAALETAGAQPVRLGPHVLRTSTAGPVAVAVLAQRLGRWGAASD